MVQSTSASFKQVYLSSAGPIRLEWCLEPGRGRSFVVADLGSSLAVVERAGGGKAGPWRRGVTVAKGCGLAGALRCRQGEEVAALKEGLSCGGTFECLVGLLEAAGISCSVWGDPFWA